MYTVHSRYYDTAGGVTRVEKYRYIQTLHTHLYTVCTVWLYSMYIDARYYDTGGVRDQYRYIQMPHAYLYAVDSLLWYWWVKRAILIHPNSTHPCIYSMCRDSPYYDTVGVYEKKKVDIDKISIYWVWV